MEDKHAHVLTICRHCGNPANKFVGPTMESARENLRNLPAFFRSDDRLRVADIQILDQDLIRIKINSHDLLVFTSECGGDFEECMAEYEQAIMMANMAKKMERLLQEALGGTDPAEFFEKVFNSEIKPERNTIRNPIEDRSTSILSQLNLPEDYLSQGH
jgi:hypothetical protein